MKWLRRLIQKKTPSNPCSTCVYWKSEEENNMLLENGKKRYCDVYKQFTKSNHSCAMHIEEKFEAQPDSIQSKEYDLNLDLSVEESDLNDTGSQQG